MPEPVSHGFQTREEWADFFHLYNDSIKNLNKATYELITNNGTPEIWINQYKEISTQNRSSYLRQEEFLKQHIRYYTEEPTRWVKETADPLLDYLFRRVTVMEDLGIAYEAAESMLPFYGRLDDEIALMKCYTVEAICYIYLDSTHFEDRIWKVCSQARIYYEDNFYRMTPEEQSLGLSLYDAAMEVLMNHLKTDGPYSGRVLNVLLDYYDAAVSAAKKVMEADKGYEFNKRLPAFDSCLAFTAMCLSERTCSKGQAVAIHKVICRMCQENSSLKLSSSEEIANNLAYMMARRLVGNCRDEEILNYLREVFDGIDGKLTKPQDVFDVSTIDAVESIYLTAKNVIQQKKWGEQLYQNILKLMLEHFSTLPYTSFLNYMSSSYTYRYICQSIRYLDDGTSLLTDLLRLTVFRQPQTAMHSIMVAKLTEAITDTLISSHPEALIGQLGTAGAGDVTAAREEILDFIYTGALLHDIGKILCANTINTQFRRLNDIEFSAIQYHSKTGWEILSGVPRFSIFRDLALGHHKSFDGTFGYPASFDNTASPVKIFIDIITVCDSLDAATDSLGRNYARVKNFDTVLEELKEEKGRRYSDLLVDIIDSSEDLKNRLCILLEKGRKETYYEVHRLIRERPEKLAGRDNT